MLRVQIHNSIREIGLPAWTGIADPGFPFCDYHFLAALETSDCVGRRTGWFPQFICAWDGAELAGALVAYLRTNSYGEYIFDFAWADAFQRSGLAYYPKVTSAIPFTPATGPKLLVRPGYDEAEVGALLLEASAAAAAQSKSGSEHALFIPEAHRELYLQAGFFLRDSYQFHWRNDGYASFADFTARLKSKRRKEIMRERAQVANAPVTIKRLTGPAITREHAKQFYEFYLSTIDKRSSFDYLTPDFFETAFADMSDKILLVVAEDLSGKPVAGALYYFGDKVLFGRNWGCLEEFKSLHFELCYYQGIEFAIEKGFERFEAGAQGEHKFQRGFLPALTYSAHKVEHPGLRQAICDHVVFEAKEIRRIFAAYLEHSPFKASGDQLRSPDA